MNKRGELDMEHPPGQEVNQPSYNDVKLDDYIKRKQQAWDMIPNKTYEEGYAAGVEEGYTNGYDEGITEGFRRGFLFAKGK